MLAMTTEDYEAAGSFCSSENNVGTLGRMGKVKCMAELVGLLRSDFVESRAQTAAIVGIISCRPVLACEGVGAARGCEIRSAWRASRL